ncbi:MAG: geranylgeranylglycerol-phosphate geranylgeranyltransferase [Flavobacteriia bacterium]
MNFIRLIRPINLAIIALTMYGIRLYILADNHFQKLNDDPVHFFLLVFSTVLIAAAGNIINDYFDVKADRINKPEKLIITKHIKRRWAIVTHWTFNGIAFGIAVYLSILYSSLSFVFIHLISINTLWFYSMLFKRKALIGNILIAGLTSMVPLLTMVYFEAGNPSNLSHSEFEPETWGTIIDIDYRLIYVLMAFAFIQNLAREIIKDIQDVKGDELIYVQSLPMLIGQKNSMFLSGVLLLILPISFLCYLVVNLDKLIVDNRLSMDTIPFALAALVNLILILIMIVNKVNRLKLYDALIKISMLLGVLATFYLAYFQR